MHYSILPIYTPPEQPAVYLELEYEGKHVLACQTESGYILERIYSTDPQDYINLLPGTRLEEALINKIVQ